MKYGLFAILILALWALGFQPVINFANGLVNSTDTLTYFSTVKPSGQILPMLYIVAGIVLVLLPIGVGLTRR